MNKRTYHPLVMTFYYLGLLGNDELSKIPYTTKRYWNTLNHEDLYGFKWVEEHYKNHLDYAQLEKQKYFYKSVKALLSIQNFYNNIINNTRSGKKAIKNSQQTMIKSIEYLSEKVDIPLKMTCKLFNISIKKYYVLKSNIKCSSSVFNLCRKTHVKQLTINEQLSIDEAVNNKLNKYTTDTNIYFSLLNSSIIFCCISTFRKYARLLRNEPKYRKPRKKSVSFKATRVLEYLHFDTTFVQTIKGKIRVVFLKDNYSKALLHYTIVPNGKSIFIKQFLIDAFSKNDYLKTILLPERKINSTYLVSDGGSENKGSVIEWANKYYPNLIKLIAYTNDFKHSNNSVESIFNTFKNEFMQNKLLNNEDELKNILERFMTYYNNERYPLALLGNTPNEVLSGIIPDKNKFKVQIEQARMERMVTNKKEQLCTTCIG